MTSVIGDILSKLEEYGLESEDIVRITAVKFRRVCTDKQVIATIANLNSAKPELEGIPVGLEDRRPDGTHAYKIEFKDGTELTCPIWWRYLDFPDGKKPSDIPLVHNKSSYII